MSRESESDAIADEMRKKRDYSYPAGPEVFHSGDPDFAQAYEQFADYTLRRDDALSRKNRELIILSYAVIEKEVEACRNHIASAFKHGATVQEVIQALQLTVRLGGGWTGIYVAQALKDLELSLENLDVDVDELGIDWDELNNFRKVQA